MGFHETQFDTATGYRTRGGPGHNTAILELPSGSEERVSRWATARRRYAVVWENKASASTAALLAFILARGGAAYGFRNKDWLDYASTADNRTPSWGSTAVSHQDQVIGTGDGTKTQFQLIKTYTSGPSFVTRKITKPVAGTVVVALGTSPASGWSVDTTTGVVTFSTAPGLGVLVKAGFEFDVPVRFEKEVDELLDISIDSFNSSSASSIGMIELIDEEAQPDSFNPRGSTDFGLVSADFTVSPGHGFTLSAAPTVSGVKAFLPNAKAIPTGGPHLVMKNDGNFALSMCNAADEEIKSIATQEAAVFYLFADALGNKVWVGK